MPSVAPREAARRMTHAGVGLLSLTLRFIPWPAAIACCVAGIIGNMWVLPRIAPKIFRPDEGTFAGVRAYPMAVLLLVIFFPLRIAAGAWAILAVGDAMAALIGRTWGKHKLPWNRDKSWQGLTAFAVFGACAGTIALRFVSERANPTFGLFPEVWQFLEGFDGVQRLDVAPSAYKPWFVYLTAGGVAAAAGALAESMRSRFDDNFRVALVAGMTLLFMDPLRGVLLTPIAH